ncbi:MAG: YqgE/AlgH family protein [Candidatus Latescibacterota bacterium]|nr:MAG: YqgE/AlgH family protein [Candidatus Latescibacterota bacterium]
MEPQVRPGCLLIASPTLRDPNFSRTVVLLCEHGDEGSMGLVINRPTEHTLAEAISEMPPRATQRLYWGGPVQQQLVLVLHRSSLDAPGSTEIVDGMALGSDSEALYEVLDAHDADGRVRVFCGYAGWSAGQLDAEMEVRSWIVGPGRAKLVFGVDAEQIWHEALRALGPRYAWLATMPADPRVN